MNPLQLLQSKVGVTPDGSFGPKTFRAARDYFKLTNNQAAHFFAQVGHETGEFKTFSENLNYSAEGLRRTFKKYFTPEQATQYARKPQAIANRVYASRMGNGPESSGDGWKFRGRGALQLTGKNNYTLFSEYVKDPRVLNTPDIVANEYAFESAIFFFNANKLWPICNKGTNLETIRQVSRIINGGYNGIDHRVELTQRFAVYGN